MPSPFPGMDPYVEAFAGWENFHSRFVIYRGDYLADRLPPHYFVRVEQRVTAVASSGRDGEQFVLDVGVSTPVGGPAPEGGGGVATAEPVVAPVPVRLRYREPTTETYLEIVRLPDQELVTVLELLSPSNKEGSGREMYHRKRDPLLMQYVHLVEIDLLVRGARLPMDEPVPPGDYFAYVSRADRRPISDDYAWSVRQSLPTIQVPLREPDPDVPVDLGVVARQVYDRSRYDQQIDYTADPPTFLRPEDRDWAREVVRQARQPG